MELSRRSDPRAHIHAEPRNALTAPLGRDRVAALVPAHDEPPRSELLEEIGKRVGSVLLVADGMAPTALDTLRRRAQADGAEVVELDNRNGKGTAVAVGLEVLLSRPQPPDAVIVVDADGQHPPEAIPSFVETAADAELVIGDRFDDLGSMPVLRRAANLVAAAAVRRSTGRAVRDTQCGMRLLRGRALSEIRFPGGGFEAETIHLKRCLAAGVRVAWIPIPAVYDGAASSFRPLRDSLVVLRAALKGR